MSREQDITGVRNSEYRELAAPLDPLVKKMHEALPWLNPNHFTFGGVAISIAGIEIAEYQNRIGKHTPKLVTLSLGLILAGAACDLFDGKLSRLFRSEMEDPEERRRDERYGQAIDPMADGMIEGWRAGSSALTAFMRKDYLGVSAALSNFRATNMPRTAKALAGSCGIPTPEAYPLGDPRIIGTSLGRKPLNLVATLFPVVKGIPVQAIADTLVSAASLVVSVERMWAIVRPPEQRLTAKEEEFAEYRAKLLGVQSIIHTGISLVAQEAASVESRKV